MQNQRSRNWRSRMVAGVVLAGGALALTQCKKDVTSPGKVASANLSAPATKTTLPAFEGKAFTFTNGGGALAPELANQTVTLTFSNTSAATPTTTITVPATGGSVTATTTFGSCIFTITSSTFAATSSLGVGKTITVNPCTFIVNTAGVAVGGVLSGTTTLTIGGTVSTPAPVSVTVDADGTVTIAGTNLGKVPTQNATGSGDD